MTNKEILDKLFGEHDRFRYMQWLRGSSCISCKVKSFCDEYYRNRSFTDCSKTVQIFLDAEAIKNG